MTPCFDLHDAIHKRFMREAANSDASACSLSAPFQRPARDSSGTVIATQRMFIEQ
jgi:hypothetical protein